MHGDHISGLLDSSNAGVFVNAKVYIEEAELAYWKGLADAGDASAAKAGLIFSTYGERVVSFVANGNEVGQTGVTAIPARGHTPGHTLFVVENLMYWGDLVLAVPVQLPLPRIATTYDIDPLQASETRVQILEQVIQKGWTIAGTHIAWPGIGRLARDGSGYGFTAIETTSTPERRNPSTPDNGGLVVVAIILIYLMRKATRN
jgi:glyoxylase-like metal-dependent hydrolase (beta-lactamase superfamily II)